jgi:hypothetical protein
LSDPENLTMTKSLLIAALFATAASLSFAQTPAPAAPAKPAMTEATPMMAAAPAAAASKPAHAKKHGKKHDKKAAAASAAASGAAPATAATK